MKLEEVEDKYDFTESTVDDIYWENHFTDFVLIVNYYWDSSGRVTTKRDQFLGIRFINCRQVSFVNANAQRWALHPTGSPWARDIVQSRETSRSPRGVNNRTRIW